MQDAAGYVSLSASYLCKMFKKTALMTFTEYLSRVRVEKAKALLANGSMQIGQVAFDAGFGSIPHFNRVFRRYAGFSPTQFRASVRE
jgi:AraC-like DNA-binding protein